MTTKQILENVEPVPIAGCWLWLNGIMSQGYGIVWADGKSQRVHRVVWEMFNGPIPDGQCVLHKCDTRLCCNPDHLFIGTYADNNHDMMDKGRHRAPPSPLEDEDVLNIVDKCFCGLKQKDVAVQYGVDPSVISKIMRGVNWSWLTGLSGEGE